MSGDSSVHGSTGSPRTDLFRGSLVVASGNDIGNTRQCPCPSWRWEERNGSARPAPCSSHGGRPPVWACCRPSLRGQYMEHKREYQQRTQDVETREPFQSRLHIRRGEITDSEDGQPTEKRAKLHPQPQPLA